MTAKPKKGQAQKKLSPKRGRIRKLQASSEDELLLLADRGMGGESRWNRPRKRSISLRLDVEVVDWFQSKGPGYQTRINRILRRVMVAAKKRDGEAGKGR